MPFVKSNTDGATLHYRDYRPSGQAAFRPHETRDRSAKPTLVFTAAWPFSSQMYDHLMLPLCESWGYRCVAIDRRGFGRSEWAGNDPASEIAYTTFADDVSHVLEAADVQGGFVGIGASLGCGELLLMLSRHSKIREACRGLVFLGPSLPIPMQTTRKSAGPPRSFWDALLSDMRDDRCGRLAAALPYIWGEAGAKLLSAGENAQYERIAMEADPFALERTVQIFLSNDFTNFLQEQGRSFEFPMLILHGNADAANPVDAGPGFIQANTVRTEIKIYNDAAHGTQATPPLTISLIQAGIAATHPSRCLRDLTEFLDRI